MSVASYTFACGQTQIDPNWEALGSVDPNGRLALAASVARGKVFGGTPTDSFAIGWVPDPAGGWTAIKADAGAIEPTFSRTRLENTVCSVVDTTVTPPVAGPPQANYNLSGTQIVEFETVDVGVELSSPSAIFVGDSVWFTLRIDPIVVVDSIRWQFLYFPKKPLPAINAPYCDNQPQCAFAPTASGGHAFVRIYSRAGNLDASSDEISALSKCPTDPTPPQDTLLASPIARAALLALLDSAWADSVAGKRRERVVFFYRDTADHAVPPNVFLEWGTDSIPPTPCDATVKRIGYGPTATLIAYGHAHPFSNNPKDPIPIECGAAKYAGGMAKYERKPSTTDWTAQAKLKVPGYIADKQYINKFRRKSFWSRESQFYPWNTAACHW